MAHGVLEMEVEQQCAIAEKEDESVFRDSKMLERWAGSSAECTDNHG